MKLLKSFQDKIFNSETGGKARRLSELVQAGFPVPPGLILTSDIELTALHIDKIKSELHDWFLENPMIQSVAVRSSASLEDGNHFSFAGQFETFLHLKNTDAIIDAIHQCKDSVHGEKVVQYCENHGIEFHKLHVSVVIQEQIHSEASGVVFTVDPMTGNDKMMIVEAAWGQGEALVQGNIIPDNYFYNWYDDIIKIQTAGQQTRQLDFTELDNGLSWKDVLPYQQVLNDAQIRQLAQYCLEIQMMYGEPMDIEWAYQHQKFYILQARPITHIHFDVEDEWTTADLKDGGISSSITTPVMFSLYEYIFEHTMPDYLMQLHILPKKPVIKKWFNSWFGFSYWNMYGTKMSMKRLPGFNERNFDTSLGIHPDYEGNGHVTKLTPDSLITGIRALIATNQSISRRISICKKEIDQVKLFFQKTEDFLHENPTLKELQEYFEKMVLVDYLNIEGSYFYTIYDNSNAATFCQEAIDKVNKHIVKPVQYLNLVTGLTNLAHLRPSVDLWKLTDAIRKDNQAFLFFQQTNAEALKEQYLSHIHFPYYSDIESFIDKYKHHSLRELDMLVPNWDEDPSQVFELLFFYLSDNNILNPQDVEEKQIDIYHQEEKRIIGRSLLRKIKSHREMLWWREEMRDYSSKMYHQIRKLLLLIGQKMHDAGWIHHRDDIFFLKFQEIVLVNKDNAADFRRLISKNKQFYESFRNFRNPNEIWNKQNGKNRPVDTDAYFKGIAGSQGVVQGRAVVIQSIYEADKILEGDILVTKFTDPAWTSYFSRISGLVTESGGILSHGAVVSREFGIPAVMGVEQITSKIKTGDQIEVNGSAGIVVMLEN